MCYNKRRMMNSRSINPQEPIAQQQPKQQPLPQPSAPAAEKIDLESEKKKLLERSEVSLWLDTYDDIFSDFDPRPYSERAVSDDFLLESRKALREKRSGKVELKFLIPEKERQVRTETTIKKRLKEYFQKNSDRQKQETQKAKNIVKILLAAGFLMLLFSSAISYSNPQIFILYLLITFFDLGGWLSVWFGLEHFIYDIRAKQPEMEFYEKMADAEITFITY